MADLVLPELHRSARAKRQHFDWLETGLANRLQTVYQRTIGDPREVLDRVFYRHVTLGDSEPQTTWDPVAALQQNAAPQLVETLTAQLTATMAQVQAEMEAELVASYREGYLWGLWELAAAGVVDPDEVLMVEEGELPDEEYMDILPPPVPPPPQEDSKILWLLGLLGVAGLSYAARAQQWREDAQRKLAQWLTSSVVGGRDYGETVAGVERILTGLEGRWTGLAQNEAHRAFSQGNTGAWQAAAGDLLTGEVWVTREDTLVCDTCADKHLTITPEQPVTDSHPSCRCVKVPILLNAQGRPVNWDGFMARLRGRRI